MKKIYITYFEPFGGRATNASKEVVLNMFGDFNRISLPVSFKKVPSIINQILKEEPRYLFMIGEAGSYDDITIEIKAKNICSGTDEDGTKKDKEKILNASSKELKTNFNINGLKWKTGEDAGEFLCNYSYYLALHNAEVTKVIFIHLPYIQKDGKNSLEELSKRLRQLIFDILDLSDSIYLRLDNRIKLISPRNVFKYYPAIRKEYDLTPIITGIIRNEDGSYRLSVRSDGYKGVRYYYGQDEEERAKALQDLFYGEIYFRLGMEEEDKTDPLVEYNYYFDISEYYGADRLTRRYMNLYICRANYTDELEFNKSLDFIKEKLLNSVLDDNEMNALNDSKEYVSRLGLEISKQILFKIVKR